MDDSTGSNSEMENTGGVAKMAQEDFPELAAIATLLKALQPLKEDERKRVVDFVFQKLGMQKLEHISPRQRFEQSGNGDGPKAHFGVEQKELSKSKDIRSLKEEKNPTTASQMVALVAYYLEHLAPESERREFITADDIKPYFNQAGFELPSAPPAMTLTHAKNAGYLNALARGQYRLNPVGHNLVAYKLPVDGNEIKGVRKPRKGGARKKKGTSARRKRGKRK